VKGKEQMGAIKEQIEEENQRGGEYKSETRSTFHYVDQLVPSMSIHIVKHI
jgi:hypothetical protein